MNVGELRKAIAHLPDDMPVLIATECGTSDDPQLYVIPAHIERTPYGSRVVEDHQNPPEWAAKIQAEYGRSHENITALLLCEWGNDKGEDITPASGPSVVDGEIAPPAIEAR